jgi:hypothetical protein
MAFEIVLKMLKLKLSNKNEINKIERKGILKIRKNLKINITFEISLSW